MKISAPPIAAADLIQGPAYLWLQVHPTNGVMMVSVFTILALPDAEGRYLIEYMYECGKYHMLVTAAEFDGSGDAPPLFPNYSRIFAADDSLYDRLYHLAYHQRLDVWLEYLGVENPDQIDASLVPNRLPLDPVMPFYTYLPGRPVVIDGDRVFEADFADLRPPRDIETEPFRPELRDRISHPHTAPTRMQ